MYELLGMVYLLSGPFDGKQNREYVDLSLTCRQPPRNFIFAFRYREVTHLLLYFDPYSGTDPLDMLLLFLTINADFWLLVLVQCISGLFVSIVSQLPGDRPMLPKF